MKNALFAVATFSIIFSFGGCCTGDGICEPTNIIAFDYFSKKDSSTNLVLSDSNTISDIRWEFLLKTPSGPQPDTLFLKDGKFSLYLYVIANENLMGVVARLADFEPDTVLIETVQTDLRCCREFTEISTMVLNGDTLLPWSSIRLYK